MVLERRSVPISYRKIKKKEFQGTMFEQQDHLSTTVEDERQHLIMDHENNKTNHTGISEWEAGVSLAKAIMGAGSFALPWAFLNMGYVIGPTFMTLLMFLSVYSLKLLVKSSRSLRERKQTTYVDVARTIFGKRGAQLTYIASISASMGVCGSYLLFIAANLQSLFVEPDEETTSMSQGSTVMFILPFAVALSSVRDMKRFAFASLLGDVSVVLGMLVVLIYGLVYQSSNFGKDSTAFGSLETMPLAFGAIGYLFLIHFLVLPIESSMANPENFQMVATKTFTACAILSGSFGVIGYLIFGSETEQIVLLNVQGSIFVSAVKLLLCADLLLTYPVVMRPSIVIVEQSFSSTLFPSIEHQETAWSIHLLTCLLLGLVAAGAATLVPAFGLLSGLVGGVSQTFLAFVLPPFMVLAKKRMQQSTNNVEFLKSCRREILLLLFGFMLIIWTLNSTWKELNKDD